MWYNSITEFYKERQRRIPRFITRTNPVDCIVCGRKNGGQQGTVHHGWCWPCVQCYCTGRPYNGMGEPWNRMECYGS